MIEITLNTSACRMNGMSREMRKNSMRSPGLPVGAASGLDGGGRLGRRVPRLADGNMVELLAAAVDHRDDAARHEHRREHRRQDAEHVHDGEAAHGPGAEREKRD